MATLQELEAAIDAFLGHPLGADNFELVQLVEHKAYEAYIFSLCIRALRELGILVALRGILGAPNPFLFRGGPGHLHSTARNYGYAEALIGRELYEIHLNVEYWGTSEITHEIDVSILKSAIAQRCRREAEDPKSTSLIAAYECKFYSNTLAKVLGREFLGLIKDLSTNVRIRGMCSNSTSDQLKLFFQKKDRPQPCFELTPLEVDRETMFVELLKAELTKLAAL